MKYLMLLILLYPYSYAFDESKQLQQIYPLQKTHNSQKILRAMQADIKTYLYQTPLSSYAYFNEHSTSLRSQALITWIHGDIYIKTLAAEKEPHIRATLNKGQYTHLGDYRYDIFTLLSDLLLQMQEDSDFSGSKEKAIMGTLIDGYFDKLHNQKLQCPCIDDALSDVKGSELLFQYTKVTKQQRRLKVGFEGLSKIDKEQAKFLKRKMNIYFQKRKLLAIKDIAMDKFGNYMLLSEGKTDKPQDDMIFILSAYTTPISYQLDSNMKKSYQNKSRSDKPMVVSSFNQSNYAGTIKIHEQDFFVTKLNPALKLEPQSEQTREYKNYASALGFILASFHANPELKSCTQFSDKINKQVKQRVVKTELISMVYAYNETLEKRWEDFTDKDLLSLK